MVRRESGGRNEERKRRRVTISGETEENTSNTDAEKKEEKKRNGRGIERRKRAIAVSCTGQTDLRPRLELSVKRPRHTLLSTVDRVQHALTLSRSFSFFLRGAAPSSSQVFKGKWCSLYYSPLVPSFDDDSLSRRNASNLQQVPALVPLQRINNHRKDFWMNLRDDKISFFSFQTEREKK